jgi:hypothetical protein
MELADIRIGNLLMEEIMYRRGLVALASTMLIASSALLAMNKVSAQQQSQLTGVWTFVSGGAKLPDGSPAWGANPKGLLIFTADGHYSSQLLRSDRPKFTADSRIKGTPEENRAAVHGYIGSFGTYSVDSAGKNFTIKFTASSYPNLEGTEQTRPFTIEGSELRITNPAPSIGGGSPSQLVYRRAK